MPPQTKAPAAVPAEPKSMTLPRKNPDYISPAVSIPPACTSVSIYIQYLALRKPPYDE